MPSNRVHDLPTRHTFFTLSEPLHKRKVTYPEFQEVLVRLQVLEDERRKEKETYHAIIEQINVVNNNYKILENANHTLFGNVKYLEKQMWQNGVETKKNVLQKGDENNRQFSSCLGMENAKETCSFSFDSIKTEQDLIEVSVQEHQDATIVLQDLHNLEKTFDARLEQLQENHLQATNDAVDGLRNEVKINHIPELYSYLKVLEIKWNNEFSKYNQKINEIKTLQENLASAVKYNTSGDQNNVGKLDPSFLKTIENRQYGVIQGNKKDNVESDLQWKMTYENCNTLPVHARSDGTIFESSELNFDGYPQKNNLLLKSQLENASDKQKVLIDELVYQQETNRLDIKQNTANTEQLEMKFNQLSVQVYEIQTSCNKIDNWDEKLCLMEKSCKDSKEKIEEKCQNASYNQSKFYDEKITNVLDELFKLQKNLDDLKYDTLERMQKLDNQSGIFKTDDENVYFQDSFSKIARVQQDTEAIAKKVAEFSGTIEDQSYLQLNELLIKNMIKLDNIDSKGFAVIELKRKEVLTENQTLQDKLKQLSTMT